MISASQGFSEAVSAYTRKFRMKLYDSQDTEIAGDIRSAKIYKGSTGYDTFQIGAVYSSYAEIVIDGQNTDLEGKELRMEIGVLTSGGTYSDIVLGCFTVLAPSATKHRVAFTAVGRIASRLEKTDFEAPATQTLASVAGAIQTQTGVTITFQSGIDTSGTIEHPIRGTCRDALGVLASVIGGYATETNTGDVLVRKYNCTPDIDWSPETMTTMPEMADNDFEITGVQATTGTGIYEDGDPVNVTVDNDYLTEDLFDDFAEALIGIRYRPGTVRNALGDPRIEPSDTVRVTIDSTAYVFPCMSVTHVYDGGLQTDIATPAAQQGEITGLLSKEARAAMETAKQAIIDADDAKKVAVNYLSRDNTGIMVADMSGGTVYTPSNVPSGVKNTHIDTDSFDVRDGQTVLASFGATSRIGKSEEPHIDISNNEMEFLSVEGLGSSNSYFKVGVLWGETADVTGRAYYSLGERDVTAGIGDGSVVQGIGNRAVYRDQLVLGRYARKGYITDRGGWIDENDYTFTVDVSDILSDTGFTDKNIKVIGLFGSNPEWSVSNGVVTVSFQKDIPDTTDTTDTTEGEVEGTQNAEWEGYAQFYIYIGEYALQIGNGKSNEPSDAFAVTWDGNIETAIDTNAASGTEDNALYTALSNLSWTDAIVSKMLGFKNIMTKILTLLKTHNTKLGYASASLIQHTCTYVSNNYVTEANFSSLKLEHFKGTRIGILHFLLYITAALPSNTWVTIGSLPITPSSGINQYVPGSDSTHPPIYVGVTATGDNAGKIRLRVFDTSSLTAQGWYRAEIPVVLPYRTD